MTRFTQDEGKSGALKMALTPLIDCIFLLLIFFMYSRFRTPEGELGARLPLAPGTVPTAREVEALRKRQVLVELEKDEGGRVTIRLADAEITFSPTEEEDRERAFARLASVFAQRLARQSDSFVILKPSSSVPFGIVIRCFDSARLAGIQDVSFAPPSIEDSEVG